MKKVLLSTMATVALLATPTLAFAATAKTSTNAKTSTTSSVYTNTSKSTSTKSHTKTTTKTTKSTTTSKTTKTAAHKTAAKTSYVYPGKPVKLGSHGAYVEEIQQQLNKLKYTVGTVDGYFGAKTLAGVKDFQKSHKLAADGVVGPATWKALFS